MRYHHGWHRYMQTFPLKKHALLFKSEYVLREFLLLLCTEKYIFLKKIYPWINLYLNIKIAWRKGLTLISLRCKAEVNPLNCLWREWLPRWCILWRSLSSAIDKRQFLSSDQTIVRVYLIETSQLFDEHGGTGELEETFLQSPWRKLLSYSSVSEEIGTGVFLKYAIRKII